MNSGRKLAQQLLKVREKGPNPWSLLKPTTRYLVGTYLAVIYFAVVILLGLLPSYECWIFLALGIVLGSILRIFKIVRLQARFWSFTQKVRNWDVVENLAQCEACETRKAVRAAGRSSVDEPR